MRLFACYTLVGFVSVGASLATPLGPLSLKETLTYAKSIRPEQPDIVQQLTCDGMPCSKKISQNAYSSQVLKYIRYNLIRHDSEAWELIQDNERSLTGREDWRASDTLPEVTSKTKTSVAEWWREGRDVRAIWLVSLLTLVPR